MTWAVPLSVAVQLLPPWRGRRLRYLVRLVPFAFLFYLAAVIFGAPVVLHWERTLLWSAWMASLTAVQTGRHPLEARAELWGQRPNRAVAFCAAWGSVFGAWVSMAVVPLDWDRPWQAYPIPATMGSLAGHAVGAAVGAAAVWTAPFWSEEKLD